MRLLALNFVLIAGMLTPRTGWTNDKFGPSVSGFEATLGEQAKSLNEKEEALEKRKILLDEKEKVLNQQIARYEKVIEDLSARLKKARKYNEEQFGSLKKMYEKMDPKKAAVILNDLDTDLAAGILEGMRKEQAGEILGKMTALRARRVTERLSDGVMRNLSSK